MKTILEVQNLKCGGCAKTITERLRHLKGIKDIIVNVEQSSVTFTTEGKNPSSPEIKTLLRKLGYPIKGEDNTLGTKAKSFVSCAVGKMDG